MRGSITDLCVNGLQAYRSLISLLYGTALAMQQQAAAHTWQAKLQVSAFVGA